jgi:hypothetical protein
VVGFLSKFIRSIYVLKANFMSTSISNDCGKSDWQSYLCRVNDEPASIFFDLNFANYAPAIAPPKLAWLWIKLNDPREDGLSKDEEFAALSKYEDDIENLLSQYKAWHYVGRITTVGRREFYFYIPENANFDLVMAPVLEANPEYVFQTGEKIDVAQDQYFKLLLRKTVGE